MRTTAATPASAVDPLAERRPEPGLQGLAEGEDDEGREQELGRAGPARPRRPAIGREHGPARRRRDRRHPGERRGERPWPGRRARGHTRRRGRSRARRPRGRARCGPAASSGRSAARRARRRGRARRATNGQGRPERDDVRPGQRQEPSGRRVEVEVAALAGAPLGEGERRPVAQRPEEQGEDAQARRRAAVRRRGPARPRRTRGGSASDPWAPRRGSPGARGAACGRRGSPRRAPAARAGRPAATGAGERDVALGQPLGPRHQCGEQDRDGVEDAPPPTTAGRATARDRRATRARPRPRGGRRRRRAGRASRRGGPPPSPASGRS